MNSSYINRQDPENPYAVVEVDGVDYKFSLGYIPEHKQEDQLIIHTKQMNAIHHRAVVKTITKAESLPVSDLINFFKSEINKTDEIKTTCNGFETPFSELHIIVAPTQV
jgi:hypothetical protein